MNIALIHGANASNNSWNWVRSQVNDCCLLDWSINDSFEHSLDQMAKQLIYPSILVSHSMGGIYAWHLAQRFPNRVAAAISVATPWGGIGSIDLWQLFLTTPSWMRTVSRYSNWTTAARQQPTPVLWTNVICCRGFDFIGVENDGVVSVKSQKELAGPSKEVELNYSHNEVLQTAELVDVILQCKLNSSIGLF